MFTKMSRGEAHKRPPIFVEPKVIPLEVLSVESVEIDGKVVSRQVKKTIDPVKQYAGMRAIDFCLENQIASGNIANLSQSTIVDSDPSHLDSQVEKLDNYLKSEHEHEPNND